MYTALKHEGAFRNNIRLVTSGQTDLKQSLIITEYNVDRDIAVLTNKTQNIMRLLMLPVHGIRSFGSAAFDMCSVANGTADAYYEWGIHCWDIAAGIILIQEAGGYVITPDSMNALDGGEGIDILSRKIICAGSKALAETLYSILDSRLSLERDDDPSIHPPFNP
jgi:myo-inositol-1(or 4)-monophosphatase